MLKLIHKIMFNLFAKLYVIINNTSFHKNLQMIKNMNNI